MCSWVLFIFRCSKSRTMPGMQETHNYLLIICKLGQALATDSSLGWNANFLPWHGSAGPIQASARHPSRPPAQLLLCICTDRGRQSRRFPEQTRKTALICFALEPTTGRALRLYPAGARAASPAPPPPRSPRLPAPPPIGPLCPSRLGRSPPPRPPHR